MRELVRKRDGVHPIARDRGHDSLQKHIMIPRDERGLFREAQAALDQIAQGRQRVACLRH